MAPIEVIDLTSSPEPDNTPARVAALSQFQPRKEKIPTIPVNGLPFFYENHGQPYGDGDNTQRPLQEAKDVHSGATAGTNRVSAGSMAPRAFGEATHRSLRESGSTAPAGHVSGPQTRPSSNGTSHHKATALSRHGDSTTGPRSPIARAGSRLPQAGSGTGNDRHAVSGNTQTGSSHGKPRNLVSQDNAPQMDIPSSYRALVDYAQPLHGISQECRARLYAQRDALVGTPLEYAIQQDIARTTSHLDTATPSSTSVNEERSHPTSKHVGKKHQICPNCSKAFIRSEKMQRHRQRCEARSNARTAMQRAAPVPPQITVPHTELLHGKSEKTFSADGSTFNPLKRPLTTSNPGHDDISNGAPKKRRVSLASLAAQQPQSRIQLIDMTDDTMENFVFSDESNNQPPESARPRPQSSQSGVPQMGGPPPTDDLSAGPSRNGLPYSAEEDALLTKLKEVDGLPFPLIVGRFSGRTQGSLTVRYYTKCKRKDGLARSARRGPVNSAPLELRSQAPSKRIRKMNIASGMVPWASVKKARLEETHVVEAEREKRRRNRLREQISGEMDAERELDADTASEGKEEDNTPNLPSKDSAYPSSMSRILRLREMGVRGRRAWTGNVHPVSDELKNHVFSGYELQRDYQGTSGDVISLAWNDHGRFAASSIAIADQQSMQYNMHRNFLVGDTNRGEVRELLEHHIPRPVVESATNINANHAMRESQDPRLFLSVVAAKFCPQDSTRLFTAGMDKTLRHYSVEADEIAHRYAIQHTAPVTLLGIGNRHGLIATGCHQSSQSINIFNCDTESHEVKLQLSPRQMTTPVFPSALKWGVSNQHRNFLLAGFSGEEEVASTATGETSLWDVSTGQRIHLGGAVRNVFDVAWNPIPSSSSIAFAVAGNANGHVVDKGMRSVVQCFAAGQKGGRGVLDWQCPALDINDLVFCPYDDNLIAAGATNGRVYIWDKRSADRSQRPLHTLKHGESLNVLDHDRDIELADTGVQFLSWGPTKDRLYSGSSDGVVKIWNPYRSPNNAHIDDISGPSRDRSAVMSGAFSPDFQELLIGTENGRINLFKSGSDTAASRKPRPFKLIPGAESKQEQREPCTAARSLVENGEIEFRPCGAMPFRQAVQGPNYQGPFLVPSETESREAFERYSLAKLTQARLDDSNSEADFTKAAKEVEIAEGLVEDLQHREDLARTMIPKAEAFQRELAESERSRGELEALVGGVERCTLDCGFLQQRHDDEDEEEVEDSGRSELRIPGFLRYATDAATSRLEDDSALPSTCTGCFPPRPTFGGKKTSPNLCTACMLKRARLTSTCARCGNATRPATEEGKSAVCERCDFPCFRCGMSATVSEGSKSVQCAPCGLEWEMGVLGYELVGSSTFAAPKSQRSIPARHNDDEDDLMEFGDENRDFYARRWDLVGNTSRKHEF